ncbi:MAG: hypothetical protein ACOYN6_11230 [Ignavibacteria bacterium]
MENNFKYEDEIYRNKSIGWFKKIIKSKITKSIFFVMFFFVVIIVTIIIYDYYSGEEKVTRKEEEIISTIKEFKSGDLVLETKWENGKIYYNLKIYDKYYKIIHGYRGFEDEEISVIFIDKDKFTIDNISIQPSELSNYSNDKLYKYGSYKKMSFEDYKRINRVTYSSNFLFKQNKK